MQNNQKLTEEKRNFDTQLTEMKKHNLMLKNESSSLSTTMQCIQEVSTSLPSRHHGGGEVADLVKVGDPGDSSTNPVTAIAFSCAANNFLQCYQRSVPLIRCLCGVGVGKNVGSGFLFLILCIISPPRYN